MDCKLYLLVAFLASIELPCLGQDPASLSGYRLPTDAQYLIMAPRKVRPEMEYRLRVSIYRLFSASMKVRATLSRDGEEYASAISEFTEPRTKELTLNVLDTVGPGVHKLLVEGLVGSGVGQPTFRNETILTFETKYVSLFIQTDRLLYYPPMTVYFRVIGVTPDLNPSEGTMTVYVLDAGRNIVMRWLQQQLNMGVFQSSFDLSYPVKPGNWSIQVDAFGHIYEEPFQVEFFYHGPNLRRLEVNVSTPMYIMDTEWGLIGYLNGEHLSGRPATGNATIALKMFNPKTSKYHQTELNRTISWYTGTIPFDYSMQELEETYGSDLAGMEMHLRGWIYDWFWDETQMGTAVTKILHDGVNVRLIGNKVRTFKPEVPFMIYFAVERRDFTHYRGRYDRQVVIQRTHQGGSGNTYPEEKMIIPDDGIIRFQVRPDKRDTKITVRIWHPSSPLSKEEVLCFRYFSPNGRYISISTSTVDPKVNQYMIYTVKTSVYVPEVHYLIVGAGTVLLGNSLSMSSQQKTFSVALSRQMSPFARIVVYFMHGGEVVTDSLNFYVKDTRLFKASVDLNYGKDFSQDKAELIGRGEPGSYMMFSGIDYEMYRRGADTFLTKERVIRELATYDYPNQSPYEHNWWYDSDKWEESMFFAASTNGMDTLTTFNSSGLIALSDRNMTLKPDWYGEVTKCNATLGHSLCPYSGECFEFKQRCDGEVDCLDGYDEAACPNERPTVSRPPDVENLWRISRFYSDVTWLWKTAYIMPVGRTEVMIDIPETTNPYVISGFALHPDEGLAIIEHPAQHDATRMFFMTIEMPDTVRRGEQIGIRLGLFNNIDQRIETIVTLHGSPLYRFVNVESFGYVSSYAPRLSGGDHQIMVLLEAGVSQYVHFPIVALVETGDVTVRVTAYSIIDSDYEEATFSVTMDGVTNGDHTPYLVDLVNQGSVIIPDYDSPIPEMFIQPELPEHLYVPGSESATFQVFGDIVAPGFFEDYLDMAITTGLPHDSAEGYMFDFAVNLQMLRYLQSTNALTTDASKKALKYMTSILMRQYAYMQDDGSFKQFRRHEQPSVWVSAFVVRILHQALASEWSESMYIPTDVVNKIAMWVAEQVSKDGHYEEPSGVIFERSMQPMTVDPDGNEQEYHIPLTAYVCISLSELTRLTGDAKVASDASESKCSEYLATKMQYITDPFQMAITAYALQQTNHGDKDNAFNRLVTMRRTGETVYWAGKEIEPNPTEIVNTVSFMQVRPYWSNLGNAMMATSYALKLYLQRNDFEGATPIMKWMQTQRNGLMRWSSSQDTLIALEALSQYSLRQTNRDIYQMQINLESTTMRGWGYQLNLNKSNFAHLFTGAVYEAYGQLKAYAQGTGYAMLQMDYSQNVEKDWQIANPEYRSFDVNVNQLRYSGKNSSVMDMEICARWVRQDLSPMAGMTVMTVEIPTGFVVNRNVIEGLYAANLPGLRRVRFRDGMLISFWQNMTSQPSCLKFRADRWYPVANVSIQHLISVYEYAETGLFNNTLYNSYTLFHQHICQVCGSYQCPYCPYYNSAPPHTVHSFVAIATVIATIFITQQLTDRKLRWR